MRGHAYECIWGRTQKSPVHSGLTDTLNFFLAQCFVQNFITQFWRASALYGVCLQTKPSNKVRILKSCAGHANECIWDRHFKFLSYSRFLCKPHQTVLKITLENAPWVILAAINHDNKFNEKAMDRNREQSEDKSHSQNQMGNNQKSQIDKIQREHKVSRVGSYFPKRWSLSNPNRTKSIHCNKRT